MTGIVECGGGSEGQQLLAHAGQLNSKLKPKVFTCKEKNDYTYTYEHAIALAPPATYLCIAQQEKVQVAEGVSNILYLMYC